MRRVRLLTDRVGEGFVQRAGECIEIERDEAERLIASLQAEAVPPEPQAHKRGK